MKKHGDCEAVIEQRTAEAIADYVRGLIGEIPNVRTRDRGGRAALSWASDLIRSGAWRKP